MAKQTVNVGNNANDGSGDAARTAFTKINQNFSDLYGAVGNATTPTETAKALGAIGVGQSWTELKNVRSADTVYTNTTGRAIAVLIRMEAIASGLSKIRMGLEVDGILQDQLYSVAAIGSSLSAIVPLGGKYKLVKFSSLPSDFGIETWVELS